MNSQPSSTINLNNTFVYSPDQIATRQEFGDPTRFTIIFIKDKRYETWIFDTVGYTAAFIDGMKVSEKYTVPEYHEEMYATTLSPDQFFKEMGVDEILLTMGKEEFILTPFDDAGVDNQLMYLEGVSIGLLHGKVSFVETYPAMTERKLVETDFSISQINELTPEEIASEGLHEYLVVHFMDGELFNSYNTRIEVRFAANEVCLTENNETVCFTRVSENEYTGEDGEIRMNFILDGFIWDIKGGSVEIESLFSRVEE